MSLVSIILVLLSAGIHIGWNSLTKSSSNPRLFSLFKGTILMMAAVILPFLVDLSKIPFNLWCLILFSGVIHTLYILSLSSAYEKGEISFVYPIVRSAPAFVPIMAYIFFAERISLRGGGGIAIVVFCIFALMLQGKLGKSTSWLKVFFKRENKWAFITLGTVVVYSIVDKAGMMSIRDNKEFPAESQGLVYFLIMNFVCYFFYWLFMLRNPGEIQPSLIKKEWWKIILAALGTMLSYTLILHVMKTEHISYIVTLRQSSILFAVIIGWLFFREPYFRLRFLIASLMILGLYLTATG